MARSVKKVPFTRARKGAPEGLVVTADRSVWVALAGGRHGVSVFNPDGAASPSIGFANRFFNE